jgi:hypothetical protein
MPVFRFRPARFAAAFLVLTALLPGPARAERSAAEAERSAMFARRYKQIQQHLLLEGAERKRERRGERLGPAPDASELAGPPGAVAPTPGAGPAPPLGTWALATNVRANNPAGDPPAATQSEVSVAAHGDNVLLAFNDGGGSQTQGYAWSTNGGVSFTDGGVPPGIPNWSWDSDPVTAINENTGEFWYAGLNSTGGKNGIAVVKATFSGGTINWDTPRMVREANDGGVLLDKEWMAVDPASGRLYVIYTAFGAYTPTDTIEIQWSADGGVSWSDPLALSSPADDGYVQGARVAVGPGGEVYATWNVIGPYPPYQDAFPVRKSTNGGVSFTPEVVAARVFSNFSSGAPGFNRGRGLTFPALAVDRSSGPHRGRVYVGWQECVDFYDDRLGTGAGLLEGEPNNTYPQANAIAIGDSIQAVLGTAGADDIDLYTFNATRGQTVVIYSSAASPSANISMRLVCGDGNAQLALAAPGVGLDNLVVFTIPVTGPYYLRMKSLSNGTPYTIYTGFHVPQADDRARDHRDVFTASSDEGVVWSAPARVNNDPPWLDNWLPELAVANLSKLYASWYDWRDASAAACNALSQVYLASSDDGGTTWATLGALSDTPSDWTDWAIPPQKSNLQPNQGDYNGLFADCQAVYGAWSDARDADVNVYTGRYPPLSQPTLVTFASATAVPRQVTLAWQASGGTPLSGTVERRDPGGAWASLGPCATTPSGRMSFVDATVTPGASYEYRLVIPQPPGGDWITCDVRVDVPAEVNRLVLGTVRPNPTQTDIIVTFGLPTNAPATLKLYDLTGREVYAREVGSLGPGSLTLNLGSSVSLRSGIYFVRLAQGGQEATGRISVVR